MSRSNGDAAANEPASLSNCLIQIKPRREACVTVIVEELLNAVPVVVVIAVVVVAGGVIAMETQKVCMFITKLTDLIHRDLVAEGSCEIFQATE